MQWLKSVCLVSCLVGITQSALAGVVVGGTRVVYDASKKESSVSVKNTEKTAPYLVQSWVEDASESGAKAPFTVTPPLFRLEPGQENALRIIRTGGSFADNKETLFWLNVKAIPSTKPSATNQLQLAIKTRIKMFYRPAGLPGNAADAYKSLTFSRNGKQLTVNNPTPYHVSFQEVMVGGKSIEKAGMVAPQSSMSWTMPEGASGTVSWKAINDYGGTSAAATAKL